jgi:hypothetical protein
MKLTFCLFSNTASLLNSTFMYILNFKAMYIHVIRDTGIVVFSVNCFWRKFGGVERTWITWLLQRFTCFFLSSPAGSASSSHAPMAAAGLLRAESRSYLSSENGAPLSRLSWSRVQLTMRLHCACFCVVFFATLTHFCFSLYR